MPNKFYLVSLDNGIEYYFKDRDKAHDALWNIYLNNCKYETEDENQEAFEQLNNSSLIDGIGIIYCVHFED